MPSPPPKKHNIEIKFAAGLENILFAGVCVQFTAQKFYRLGQWKGYS